MHFVFDGTLTTQLFYARFVESEPVKAYAHTNASMESAQQVACVAKPL